ncbi:MAG: hypothetical protein A2722_04160 [Candidatus Doudnabacteria bacterium RIFCSPHIGHO2_01_FULL_50_11]|uniref:Protein-export membrane protein SecG n=1 Tax=Candidatus Doudnabacteria bacterium RIFCSPHIGHO2_01_FULL_50_11 TaxID=1817828 RepID=A0A1F5PG39_9BACT|nr:MAG: hypothetical protein A2722_04160 [Candidatus Doudnabacteria bacterium RIFCSPHIGHO2_01_FULL_50_11]HLC44890.1 hypothetical protein [Patescibacteria group bacterium]
MNTYLLIGGFVLGILILRFSKAIYKFMGQDPDAERMFGGGLGGTYTAIRLIALVLVVGSIIVLLMQL